MGRGEYGEGGVWGGGSMGRGIGLREWSVVSDGLAKCKQRRGVAVTKLSFPRSLSLSLKHGKVPQLVLAYKNGTKNTDITINR